MQLDTDGILRFPSQSLVQQKQQRPSVVPLLWKKDKTLLDSPPLHLPLLLLRDWWLTPLSLLVCAQDLSDTIIKQSIKHTSSEYLSRSPVVFSCCRAYQRSSRGLKICGGASWFWKFQRGFPFYSELILFCVMGSSVMKYTILQTETTDRDEPNEQQNKINDEPEHKKFVNHNRRRNVGLLRKFKQLLRKADIHLCCASSFSLNRRLQLTHMASVSPYPLYSHLGEAWRF